MTFKINGYVYNLDLRDEVYSQPLFSKGIFNYKQVTSNFNFLFKFATVKGESDDSLHLVEIMIYWNKVGYKWGDFQIKINKENIFCSLL